MTTTESAMEDIGREENRIHMASLWRALALPVFVLLCWFLAVRHMSLEWTLNEQYHFGWVVPLLALYLLWTRFENAPAASAAPRSGAVVGVILFVALAEVLLLPLREANADWRLFGGALTGLAALATLAALGQTGGKSWMARFAFPVLFVFTAVPLPCGFEVNVMQWLMGHNAKIAAEILHWFGVVADVQGNLIKLASATVGVDEACSGIRSLQGSLMASLFVGEIFELAVWRRAMLVLAGAGWALLTNVGRTVFLALMAERGGTETLERWHDPAGYWALAACVAGVTFAGWLQRGRANGEDSRASGDKIEVSSQWRARLSAASPAALAGTVLILCGWGGAEAWFRMHEAALTRAVDWSFQEPTQAARFQPIVQPARIQGDLRYNFHSGGQWRDAEGRNWVANYFRWNPGPRALRTLVIHDPRVCLGATGKEFVQTLPEVPVRVGDIILPFDAYWFREKNRAENVFVFNCVAEDAQGAPGQEQLGALLTLASRFQAVWAGKRNLGQRRLELAVWGMNDPAVAREALEELLRRQMTVRDTTIVPG